MSVAIGRRPGVVRVPHAVWGSMPRETDMEMKRILVVEDEEGLLEGLANNLRYEGYEVLTARTGQEGLRTALKQKPDAVLLDIMLPEKDGFTVLKELRQRHKDIPVLIMTARNFECSKTPWQVSTAVPVRTPTRP